MRRCVRAFTIALLSTTLIAPAALAASVTDTISPAATGPTTTSVNPSADPPYLDLERFTLRLINCTRTGGWVRANGTCKDYGSGKHSAYRKPLTLSKGLSNRVARPYATKIARADYCGHGYGGSTIGKRFQQADFRSGTYGENVACGTYAPRKVIINTHRSMQAERSYRGGHWKNFKNKKFRTVGIGVSVVNGNVRIVEDFYRP